MSAADLTWHTSYLLERFAEHPPIGYVTYEEAHDAVRRGVSWSEAAAEPSDGPSRPGPIGGNSKLPPTEPHVAPVLTGREVADVR